MLRTILSVIAGIAAWAVLVTASDLTLRHFWPDYAAVFKAMNFTLAMMIARLSESTVTLAIAAWIAGRVAPGSRAAPWALGLVLLAIFIPIHYSIWSRFPIWYHAYFLASLVVIPPIVGNAGAAKAA